MIREKVYRIFIRPFLFLFDPEKAHEIVSFLLFRFVSFLPYSILKKCFTYSDLRLKVSIKNLVFENPVGLAGGFDKTGLLYPSLSKMGFGFVESGSFTFERQDGNDKPRVFRLVKEKSIFNRMGFNNPGVKQVLENIRNQKKTSPRGLNIGKSKIASIENANEDYLKSFEILNCFSDYIVINVSSPNTKKLRSLQSSENLTSLIKTIKKSKEYLKKPTPIFVKIAPDLSQKEQDELIQSVLKLKISGVILTNTSVNRSGAEHYANLPQDGGVSGKLIQEKSTEMIRYFYKKLKGKVIIIGVGGIDSGKSALEKILAGASLIQIYTGLIYQGPFLPYLINQYLSEFLKKNRINSISEIIGKEKELLI